MKHLLKIAIQKGFNIKKQNNQMKCVDNIKYLKVTKFVNFQYGM